MSAYRRHHVEAVLPYSGNKEIPARSLDERRIPDRSERRARIDIQGDRAAGHSRVDDGERGGCRARRRGRAAAAFNERPNCDKSESVRAKLAA